jgi:hypothetical protein
MSFKGTVGVIRNLFSQVISLMWMESSSPKSKSLVEISVSW